MTGARGIMAEIGTETVTVIAREIEIGIEEMIVAGMIEIAIETGIGKGIGIGREIEIETGIGIDVGMNLLAVAHLHLIDIVKPQIHLATTVLPLVDHRPQRPKRRNRG